MVPEVALAFALQRTPLLAACRHWSARRGKQEARRKEASHNRRHIGVTYTTHVSHLDTVATKGRARDASSNQESYGRALGHRWAIGHRPWTMMPWPRHARMRMRWRQSLHSGAGVAPRQKAVPLWRLWRQGPPPPWRHCGGGAKETKHSEQDHHREVSRQMKHR